MNIGPDNNGAAVLEIKNIPTSLILYAIQQWTTCGKYVKGGASKNTNEFLKGISVWLILKNETTSGQIKNYRSQLPGMAAKCKMSVRTLDKYLAWLRKERLVTVENGTLCMAVYKTLRRYGFKIEEREKTVYYDTTNKTTLAEMLLAIGLRHMKQRWMQMYWKKVNRNPDAFNELRNHLVVYGADQSQLDNPEYFRQCHMELLKLTYEKEEPGQTSFYLLHKFIDANPDLNCRQETYAFKLGYSSTMGFCYLKFRLQKKGLIQVRKEHVESEYRARKDEKTFHCSYVRRTKRTVWFRPDQITISKAIFQPKKPA